MLIRSSTLAIAALMAFANAAGATEKVDRDCSQSVCYFDEKIGGDKTHHILAACSGNKTPKTFTCEGVDWVSCTISTVVAGENKAQCNCSNFGTKTGDANLTIHCP